jgi:quercetin dioxygenase-like cupin family protein
MAVAAVTSPPTTREKSMNRKILAALVVCGSVSALSLASSARATPATPPPPAPVAGTSVIGVLDGPSKAKNDGIELKVKQDTAVRVFTLTYPVGATSGWHSHPGIVVATVESGTVRRQIGCKTDTFSVDDSFTEAEPHQVTNVGETAAVLRITQLYPASLELGDLRIDEAAPTCRGGS